ncbi:hypothetical protein ACMC5O_001962 [Sphingomonas sediminicola]|uniref:hypothetical protein n=1 Tax=Sphingomonas sediminicola TaxID=386874 RepID=UPI003CEB24E0
MAMKQYKGQAPRTDEEREEAGDDAGKWFPVVACGQCCHRQATTLVAMQRVSGSVVWKGVMRCGSVWLCGECAQKIERVRGDEVKRLIETARARGHLVVMITHTFPHTIAETCRESMDGLSGALRTMRQRGGYQRFRKSLGFQGLVRSTEITHGWNGWHPHNHELWILDPVLAGVDSQNMDGPTLEKLIADKVFPQWEAAAKKVFGEDRAPDREHGIDVSIVWSANDYLAKCPDRAAQLEANGKNRWEASAEMTKSTAKMGRKKSRTFWDILEIADGSGPSPEEQKAAGLPILSVERARELVLDYGRGTWRKRRMYWTPGHKTKDGYVEGLRERFDIGEELTDEQIADGELPMTMAQAKIEVEKKDPISHVVEFDLFSLSVLGSGYMDDLFVRAAHGRSILDVALEDGWILDRLGDHVEGYARYGARHRKVFERLSEPIPIMLEAA